MTTRIQRLATAMAVALLASPAPARAGEAGETGKAGEAGAGETDGEEGPEGGPEESIGLDVEVEIASAFVFRGLNLFGDAQRDQRASAFPAITVSVGPVSGGYWGAYQLSGDNALRKLDEGFSAENDLWVSYEAARGQLGYAASLTYYTFPFADRTTAGAATPMYLEPAVGVRYETSIDLGLDVSYFRGLQDATVGLSYLYISPSITRKRNLTDRIELNLGATAGYKLWTNDPGAADNTYDLQLDAGLSIPFGDAYIAPTLHLAWTNLAGLSFGEQLVVWAGVRLGGSASKL
jgi:hypothetical protein